MADASPAKHTGMDQQYSPVVVVGVLGILLLFLWPVIALLVPAAIVGGLLVFIFKRINASTSEDSNEVVKDLKESAVQMKEVPQPRNADDAHAPPPVATAERIETTQVASLPQEANGQAKQKPEEPAPKQPAPQTPPSASPAFIPATGSAAILARLKADKAKSAAIAEAKASSEALQKEAIIAYASQTGTAQEIARNIQAEASKYGITAKVMSCNELGFENVRADKSSVIVLIASSTGDGDAPDNSAKFYAAVRRKSNPADTLKGVSFTTLGLGDSNYTRFMAVSRSLRARFADLGATQFYGQAEADEVDGIEDIVDKWVAGLWPALKAAVDGEKPSAVQAAAPAASVVASAPAAPAPAPVAGGAAPTPELVGVPALSACRVAILWESDPARAQAVAAAEKLHPTPEDLAVRDPSGAYSPEAPFWAPVSGASLMTDPASDRRVLHLEINVEGSGMAYHPGDSIGILPENDPALVKGLLRRLGEEGDRVFSVAPLAADGAAPATAAPHLLPHLRWPCTLRQALTTGCDLTSVPRKSLLRILGEHCTDPEEQRALLELSSRGGRQLYATHIMAAQPSLLDLLQKYPSCQPPLAALLDALPPLAPRMYSIASARSQFPTQVQVAFSVVKYETPSGTRVGVATTWLDKILQPLLAKTTAQLPQWLPVYLRSGGGFRPPASLQSPVIMIGPGTGVAPFRGFLQERRAAIQGAEKGSVSIAPAWLFFGCRREKEDFLYRSDLEGFVKDGTLDRLEVAFSRGQPGQQGYVLEASSVDMASRGNEPVASAAGGKLYVQDCMAARGADLWDMLEIPECHVYICGDGVGMAKDVHACLVNIAEKYGGLPSKDAAALFTRMTKESRYIRDIWS